jgi:hypothetical protein
LEGYSIICETNYLSNGTVKFVLNWTDSQGIDQYISNNNSASGVAKNFLMVIFLSFNHFFFHYLYWIYVLILFIYLKKNNLAIK